MPVDGPVNNAIAIVAQSFTELSAVRHHLLKRFISADDCGLKHPVDAIERVHRIQESLTIVGCTIARLGKLRDIGFRIGSIIRRSIKRWIRRAIPTLPSVELGLSSIARA